MPQYWILKTEPNSYSFEDLQNDAGTVWDGVKNNLALKHIRTMKSGDKALVYHTGTVKALIGEANVVSDPYPDPQGDSDKLVVVDLKPGKRLGRPVPLAEIKAEASLADLALVRMGRLSVVPATDKQWKRLMAMGQG